MATPRGIRNNNPGNIRWGSDWRGLIPQEKRTDKSFCQFKDPVYGIRALVKIIFTYRDKYNLNTVESIINRYAPPVENNTQGYITRVCDALGVQATQTIALTNSVLTELVRAITAVENGNLYYYYYNLELIERAIELAKQ